ncbi:MAG: aminotransferase class V-fold PLP-dependent enzyme [Hyphomonadaceae bacterium]|nr:aminotransferase class V-fold PLP-dependent enzyme [Hyphomonadaceae bacterium]
MLDLPFVRAQFPAFSEPSLQNQAFFENAGGSYTCRFVIDRLTRFYRERKVQPYAAYEASRLGGEEMDEARARLAALLGVQTDELSFGPSTSQNTYVLAQAFAQMLKPGDAIIVTNQDHEANSGPWRRLADRGLQIREWKMDPAAGHLDIADLKNLLDERVKLVCFPHCSNIVAEINPVSEIAKLAHANGAYVCVDGVSYAPHGLPNVAALGADVYLFSAYKTYGPHQGVMVVRRALADALPNQGHFFNADSRVKRLTPAGPDHAQIAASAGIADYIDALHAHHAQPAKSDAPPTEKAAFVHDLMRGQEVALLQPLLDYLASKNSVRLIGPTRAEARAPTLAMILNEPAEPIAAKLAPKGVNIGGGHFYGARCLQGVGVDPFAHGALRASFVHYTSPEEIQKLIRALDEIL